jgi:tetratricopeptide (TPR) repeat protein
MTKRWVKVVFCNMILMAISPVISACSSPTFPYSKPHSETTSILSQNSPNAQTFYQQGIEKIKRGNDEYVKRNYEDARKNYDAAIANFSQAIQLNPNFAEAFDRRGHTRMQYWSLRQSYEEKSGYNEAIVDFSEAIRLKSNYVQAYYDRGFWRTRFAGDGPLVNFPPDVIKQYQKDAIADLTRAIQLRPTFAAAYYLRGRAQQYSKFDEQGAKKDFVQVIQLDPNLFDIYPDRRDLVKLELRDNQAVLRTLTQTLQNNSKNVDVLYQRGFVRLDAGDVKGSIEDFSQIIQQKNSDKDAYYGRGLAYYQAKRYELAIKVKWPQKTGQVVKL